MLNGNSVNGRMKQSFSRGENMMSWFKNLICEPGSKKKLGAKMGLVKKRKS